MSDEKPIYHARPPLPSDDIPPEAMATVTALQQRIAELEADRDKYLTCLAQVDDALPSGHGGKPLEGIADLEAQLAAVTQERDEERAQNARCRTILKDEIERCRTKAQVRAGQVEEFEQTFYRGGWVALECALQQIDAAFHAAREA